MNKKSFDQKLFEERRFLGWVTLTKETAIPATFDDIVLNSYDRGPIDTKVMKPFRIWKSPIEGVNGKEALLLAFQRLLFSAIKTIRFSKGSFVLYIEGHTLKLDSTLVGGIYKI